MKNLSDKIKELNSFIIKHNIRSISFDIDGTLYPMALAHARWRRIFLFSPVKALRFLIIRKKWEGRRKGNSYVAITPQDIREFENFLEELLTPEMVPAEIHQWIQELGKRNLDIYFLTDHGAEVKLKKLGLLHSGPFIDGLKETGELKPHFRISQVLKEKFLFLPEKHLHLGDRWTDEAQAKLLGSYFQYFIP